jgi:hypothetical protein
MKQEGVETPSPFVSNQLRPYRIKVKGEVLILLIQV